MDDSKSAAEGLLNKTRREVTRRCNVVNEV